MTTHDSMQRRFQWRAFTTLYVALSFAMLAVSGLVLYVAPPGRVANWSRWTLGLLDKSAWQGVHTIFALLFVLAGGLHLFFNWRILWSYLRTRLVAGIRLKRELAAAAGLAAGVLALTLAGAPPFGSVIRLGEDLKNGWVAPEAEPPIPHAELLTLERLAETTKLPLETTLANLEAAGYGEVSAKATLAALAAQQGRTPQQVWVAMRGKTPAPVVTSGGGYGRKTVGEVCRQIEVPLEDGLARLRQQGLEASAETPLRELAERSGRTPHDLVQVLAGA